MAGKKSKRHQAKRQTPRTTKAPRKRQAKDEFIGRLKGKIRIVGDIVSPISPIEDWESLKE